MFRGTEELGMISGIRGDKTLEAGTSEEAEVAGILTWGILGEIPHRSFFRRLGVSSDVPNVSVLDFTWDDDQERSVKRKRRGEGSASPVGRR